MARRLATSLLWFGVIIAALTFPGPRPAQARESALCERCSRGCNAQFAGAFHACKTFTCQDEVKVRSRKCFLICAGDEANSGGCHQSELSSAPTQTRRGGGKRGGDGGEHEERLGIRHHERGAEPWRTLAAIAMVAEQLDHKQLDECEVAAQIDRAGGGNGRCCDDHGNPVDGSCPAGLAHRSGSALLAAYFQSRATDLHQLLAANELQSSLDGGFPVIAMLRSGGADHPVVIVGYREGGTFLVDDPAAPAQKSPARFSPQELSKAGWVDTWYFRSDAVSGHFSAPAGDTPPAQRPPAPEAASKVGLGFPLLKDPPTQKYVGSHVAGHIGALRACYDRGLLNGDPLPSPATAVLSFAIASGTPTLILVKDSGGLSGGVTSCVTDEVSRWTGLYPASGDYPKTQELAITFTALAPARTTGIGSATGQVAPR